MNGDDVRDLGKLGKLVEGSRLMGKAESVEGPLVDYLAEGVNAVRVWREYFTDIKRKGFGRVSE